VWIAVLVTVLTIGLLARMTVIGLNPDLGPEGTKVRNIAKAASKHLSNNPNVVSTTITEAKASTGTELIARLKDDTSPDAVTNLLTSTHQAAFDKNDPDTHITLNIVLNWTLGCVVFLGLGSFSSRESIGWIPCQQRNTQRSSRRRLCVKSSRRNAR